MGGPTEQTTSTVFIPPGEGHQTFAPSPLASIVENLEIGDDGILQSIVGPSSLRIKTELFNPRITTVGGYSSYSEDTVSEASVLEANILGPKEGRPFGCKSGAPQSIFSTRLMNGTINVLLYRIGTKLYRFKGGADDADEVLISNLALNPDGEVLDSYAVISDRIIYSNGIDAPKVITYDGSVFPLGFSRPASEPFVQSPSQPDYDETANYYPNAMGYSWQGRIGTPGDELAGQRASLLKGTWYYYFQYEDINGNLSEMSGPSSGVTIHTNQSDPFFPIGVSKEEDNQELLVGGETRSARNLAMGVEIDDLTRRFLVSSSGDAPEHTVATRIYRTQDTVHKDSTPRLLDRVPGSKQFYYDDNHADTDLGFEWTETISVPIFRVSCAHQGRLIIGNTPGEPGIVRRSQLGFPGTFEKNEFIFPDSSGREITALKSHRGNLIAFTENSIYLISDDFSVPQPISSSIGCISPKTIHSFNDGSLIFLHRDGFYSLDAASQLTKISGPIDKLFRQDLNTSRFQLAAGVYDPKKREYSCAIAEAGRFENSIILTFDGIHWRRKKLGITISDMCVSNDHTKHILAVGTDWRERNVESETGLSITVGSTSSVPVSKPFRLSRVFIFDRQSTDYFAPVRRCRYRSTWLRSSEFGLTPTNVRTLYLGLMDSWVGSATVRLYKNGSWKPISTLNNVLLHGLDKGSGIIDDVASEAVVGASRARDSRLFWRQIPVDIQNADSWAFEIEIMGTVSPFFGSNSEAAVKVKMQRFLASRLNLEYSELPRQNADFAQSVIPSFRIDSIPVSDSNISNHELGRLKIACFAFDTSIATKGSPRGRVPKRSDT